VDLSAREQIDTKLALILCVQADETAPGHKQLSLKTGRLDDAALPGHIEILRCLPTFFFSFIATFGLRMIASSLSIFDSLHPELEKRKKEVSVATTK